MTDVGPGRDEGGGGHVETGHGGGHGEAGHDTTTGLSNNKLGMWLFLGSECLLFGGLISTYMLYRGRTQEGPKPEQIYDIPFTSISSFILLMSSLTMVLAVSASKNGDVRRTRLWLCATAAAGLAVRRRPGLRVHGLLPGGPGLHHQPVRLQLLHVDRLPRRPRHASGSSC